MKKILIVFLLMISLFVLSSGVVFAQVVTDSEGNPPVTDSEGNPPVTGSNANRGTTASKEDSKLVNPIGVTTVEGAVAKIIKIFLGIIGTVSLVMFIYGGIMILTSAGKEEQVKKGRETLVWASLGILLVFASYAILTFVLKIFTFEFL